MAQQQPEISVVLPGFNEADNIEAMLAEVDSVLQSLNVPGEIVYVDDGSTDASRAMLEKAAAIYPHLRALYHRTNFGQSAAIHTGIQAARGRLVVTLDSDLQNDPADIPAMIDRMEKEGADAVCGVRQKRQDSAMKRFSSRVANAVRGAILSDGITDAGCALRVMKREALHQLPAFRALHRFLPTLMGIHGYKVIEMPINHRPREAGVSKYGVGNRLWVGLFDIIGLCWYRRRFLPPSRLSD